jgi:putative oxidoreductase
VKTTSQHPVRDVWNRLVRPLDAVSDALIALVSRLALASVFWLSGRTKVEGWIGVNDTALALFADEYQVPLLDPSVAAHLATWAEHALPILLVLGLGTRVAAIGLMAMTAVIQCFVYPDAWPTHLTWLAPGLYLIARGGGAWSLDHRLGIR